MDPVTVDPSAVLRLLQGGAQGQRARGQGRERGDDEPRSVFKEFSTIETDPSAAISDPDLDPFQALPSRDQLLGKGDAPRLSSVSSARASQPGGGGSDGASWAERALRVLLLDEDADDRALAVRVLKKEFPAVKVTQIWEKDRLEQALEGRPADIVVTDYHLLWGDGIQVLQMVRERWPDCPVIMFTGAGSEEVVVEAMKQGLDDYVVKHPRHFIRLPAVVRRVIEHRERQLTAREAEDRYRRLFDGLPLGLYRATPSGQLLEASAALVQLLRLPESTNLVTLDTQQVYMDPQRRAEWLAELDANDVVKDFVAEFRRPDGERIWVCENTRAVRDDEGHVLYYEGSLEDITARKKAEMALQASEHELAVVFDNAPFLMLLLDRRLRIRKANRAVSHFVRRDRRSLLGRTVARALNCAKAVRRDPAGGRSRLATDCRECTICRQAENTVMNGIAHEKVEVRLPVVLEREKQDREFLVTTTPVRVGPNRLVLLCLQDITEQRQVARIAVESKGQLEQAMGAVIHALAEMLATRDPYTAGHQQRVAELACAIAQELGLSEDHIAGIRMASAIHDLGKVAVPSEILTKPGRLTRLEFDIMKMHPQVGYDILSKLTFPWPVADVAVQHHERLDGSGYPVGLVGDQIRLEARIVAVADVVEAIASHRPYRPSLGVARALAEITSHRGSRYDPDVVDACVALANREGFTLS
ncbi:MAG: HD domain-containing phosphohydrolase [Pseudomonadota bacterium]